MSKMSMTSTWQDSERACQGCRGTNQGYERGLAAVESTADESETMEVEL